MSDQPFVRSPRSRAASGRVHADQKRASAAMRRSLMVLISFWLMWSTIQFLDMYRDPSPLSAQNLIIAVLTLGIGWFILRMYRRASGART